MLVATLGFTLMQVFIKELGRFHVFEIVFFRSGVTALFCMTYLKSKGISMIGNQQKWLILRSICGIISMTLFFATIQRMPLGASVSLKYLSPIFAAIFAVLFINEKIKPIQWLYFSCALVGVFMLKGFDTRIDTISLIMGLVGAVFVGFVFIIIRRIGDSEHSMVIVNYFMLSAAILSGFAMLPFWKNPTSYEWILLIGMGIAGYFGQIYMTKAFQLEAASRVAPVKYMGLIYSLIIGLFWFGESYSLLSFIGILLIVGSMIMNLLVKQQKVS
jgi:drug/metabolite transporter (DMT)-like permease